MINLLRQRTPACPAERAALAARAYEADPAHRPALGVLYGYRQITNRKGQLVDGPARLAVVTAETIAFVEPATGTIRSEAPLEGLAAYIVDAEGRFVFRFDDRWGHSHLGSFRPLAVPDAPLSACGAASLFVRRATAAWEARTGRPFCNTWMASTVTTGRC